MWKDILKVGLGVVVGSALAYALYAYAENKKQTEEQPEPTHAEEVKPEPVKEPVKAPTLKKERRTFGKQYSDKHTIKSNPFPYDKRSRVYEQEKMQEKKTNFKTVDILYRLCSPNCTGVLTKEDLFVIQQELDRRGVEIRFSVHKTPHIQPANQEGIFLEPFINYKEPEPPFEQTKINDNVARPEGYMSRNIIQPQYANPAPEHTSTVTEHHSVHSTGFSSGSVDFMGVRHPETTGNVFFGGPSTTQQPKPATMPSLEQRQQKMREEHARARAAANRGVKRSIPLEDILNQQGFPHVS